MIAVNLHTKRIQFKEFNNRNQVILYRILKRFWRDHPMLKQYQFPICTYKIESKIMTQPVTVFETLFDWDIDGFYKVTGNRENVVKHFFSRQ